MLHPRWLELLPHLEAQRYDRDGGHKDPRYRIEADAPDNPTGEDWLTITMPCVQCQKVVKPFRVRLGQLSSRHLFYAATCPLNVDIRCSRGAAVRAEYRRVIAAIKAFRGTP